MVVGNTRLPWMQVALAPKELIADVRDGKEYASRCFVAKIKDWYEADSRPTLEIIKSVDAKEEDIVQEEKKEEAGEDERKQ